MAMKIRLNVIEWIEDNFGREASCPLCGKELDTTEHVFVCEESANLTSVTIKDLEEGERMREIVELFTRNEEKRRELLVNNIKTNFETFRREGTL